MPSIIKSLHTCSVKANPGGILTVYDLIRFAQRLEIDNVPMGTRLTAGTTTGGSLTMLTATQTLASEGDETPPKADTASTGTKTDAS